MKIIVNEIDKRKFKKMCERLENGMSLKMAEKSGEICKAISMVEEKDSKEYRENLKEEIRDMYICLASVQVKYDLDFDEVGDMIDKKLYTGKFKWKDD